MPERDKKYASGAYALRLGKGRESRRLEAAAAREAPGAVALVVVRVGQHRIAIEATRVIDVRAGAVWNAPDNPRRPVQRADLHLLLRVAASASCQTVLCRADGKKGRGDGARVAFAVDDVDRLVVVALESLAPLPPIAREQIEVDFLVGVALLPVHRGAELRSPEDTAAHLLPGAKPTPVHLESTIERAAFLLDPTRLARLAEATEPAHG